MKLSIIIPVYRTPDTLSRCLDSILRQSFTDYEIILVDDGSPDECPHLCDEYAASNKNIQVIHKKNGGLSDARNAGIERAQGKYITFIDSDDAIQEDTLIVLMEELEKYPDIDILEYPIKERIGNPNREKILSFKPQKYNDVLDYWLGERAFAHTYACNKIFKCNLFHNIQFPKGKSFEDVLTTPYLMGLIPVDKSWKSPCIKEINVCYTTVKPTIKVTDKGLYLYYWNNQGITAKAKYQDLLNLYLGQTQSMLQLFERMKGREEEILAKYQYTLEEFMTSILNVLLDLYEESGKYEPTPPLINWVKWLSQYHPISSWKLKLLNIIGYHRLCKLNKLIHQIYRHH